MDYEINKTVVLNCLGYRGQVIDDLLGQKINDTVSLAYKLIIPRSVYGFYKINHNDGAVNFEDKFIVRSVDLNNLLKNSKEAVLAAFTLGCEIEQNIRRLSYLDLNKALILDCCALAAIESYADNIITNLSSEFKKQRRNLTNRFSCGYGDFSLAHQSDIISALSAQKRIGVYTTKASTLYPKKSMTAVIGITNDSIYHTYYASCENCAARSECKYRKAGRTCVS